VLNIDRRKIIIKTLNNVLRENTTKYYFNLRQETKFLREFLTKHVAKWPTSLLLPWCGLTAYLAGQPYQRWAPAMAYSSVSGYLVRATRCNCDKPLLSPGWPAVCWNSWQLLPSHLQSFSPFSSFSFIVFVAWPLLI